MRYNRIGVPRRRADRQSRNLRSIFRSTRGNPDRDGTGGEPLLFRSEIYHLPGEPLVRSKRDCTLVLLAAVGLLGFMAVLFATRWGIGIEADSVFYLSEARELLNGQGFQGFTDPTGGVNHMGSIAPTNIHPPLYPALIAAGGITGMDLRVWARWLNAILFAANILLVGIVLYRFLHCSPFLAVLGSLLILTATDIVSIHTEAMSEPAFIFLALLGLTLLAAYIENPKDRWVLLASSLVIGLAFLERYPGIALVVAGAAGLLFLGDDENRRRVGDAFTFTALSALPMAVWLLRNAYVAGSATGRYVVFHPNVIRQLPKGFLTLSHWLIPQSGAISVDLGIAVALMMGGVITGAFLWRPQNNPATSSVNAKVRVLPRLLALFIVAYVGGLIASMFFLDADLTLDGRMLAPVYVSMLVLVLFLVPGFIRADKNRLLWGASIILCIALAGTHLIWSSARVRTYHREGQGYTRREWRESPTIRRVKALPSDVRVYSNAPDAIYFLIGKLTEWVPPERNYLTGLPNSGYLGQVTAMGERIRSRKGVLVYFNGITWRPALPSARELREELPFLVVEGTGDGFILRAQR
jgi:4-amino-4-deoxy-L-arabinose transferase-like glycosyltransferase